MREVRVQTADFDLSTEVARLRADNPKVGAVVTFVGAVRDLNDGAAVAEMELEHYPGMTEAALQQIVDAACTRWPLAGALVIHRVGPLKPLEQIVLV
ncbi:MAG: molybdenum cofactor biosynthesis protein MoaE, partial [Massilia sp.]